jgi:general secretion pathway protein K
MALVLTLTVTVIITALVVEFVYAVYVNTGFLYNWRAAQELSQSAKSGASLAAYLVEQEADDKKYTYPGAVYLPPVDPFMDGSSVVSIRIEDEDSKFNLNSLLYENGDLNEEAYGSFTRMLEYLSVDTAVADHVADWMDRDDVPRREGSEDGARNAPMQSSEELLLVPGVDSGIYDTLIDYISVFGSELININGAEVPVLISLSEEMAEEMAERLVSYRGESPFESTSDITKVAGFEALGISLIGRITVKGSAFRVLSTATSADGVSVVVECVLDEEGKVSYWRES